MKDFFKHYIQHYRHDKFRFWYVVTFGVLSALGVLYYLHSSPLLYLLGYVLTDPMNYYVRVYHRHQKLRKTAVRIQCHHEPLLVSDGKPVYGTVRCKHCGLNEDYWKI